MTKISTEKSSNTLKAQIQKQIKSPFVRFLAVGGLATGTQYVLLIIFIEYFILHKVASSAIAYALSSILNYLLNYYLTFSSKQNHAQSFAKFSVVVVIGLLINIAIFKIALLLGTHYLLAQIIATIITTLTNYLMHKYWIYRNDNKTVNPEKLAK